MKWLSAGVKVGILFLLVVFGGYAVWSGLAVDPAGANSMTLSALFKDASGMPVGSKVVVAGLPVGEISGLGIEGRYARVRFRIRGDVPVWSSAVVFKKATSLLGDNYLEIDPGGPESVIGGQAIEHKRLRSGDSIESVVEGTSPDQLLRRIEQSLPNVDAVLLSVKDLSEDMRRVVNGPIASVANRVDDLVQREAQTVSDILAKADRAVGRIDEITKDIRAVTDDADTHVQQILTNLESASQEAKTLVASAKAEVEATGAKLRDKLDQVDQVIANTELITAKVADTDGGTLGRLVNDTTIADNVEDITDDAKGFLGTLFNLKTFVGLRSEYNVLARQVRHYISIELHTRPDKYYLVELEKGPRGGYPDVTLTFDPNENPEWVRRALIEDKIRFTFQFAKRFDWLTVRYGIKESTGGVGADAHLRWWDRTLDVSFDLFDATWDQFPRVKIAAALEVYRGIYVLGGVDEVLNEPATLVIQPWNNDDNVPVQFDEFRYGRDFFAGAMLRFNDRDLAALLAIGGGALSGVSGD